MPLSRDELLHINQAGWDQIAAQFYGGTALPEYGPLAFYDANIPVEQAHSAPSLLPR